MVGSGALWNIVLSDESMQPHATAKKKSRRESVRLRKTRAGGGFPLTRMSTYSTGL